MKKKGPITKTLNIPEGIEVLIDKTTGKVKVKKDDKEIERTLFNKNITIEVKEGKVIIKTKKGNRKQKRIANTFSAHIKNMFKGVSEGHVYKLKICSSHFPMNVSIKGNELVVENFLGEKVPRRLKLKENVDVKIEGDIITVTSINKELAGNMASDIEKLTRRTNYDRRVFQDGIYIIMKDGKELK